MIEEKEKRTLLRFNFALGVEPILDNPTIEDKGVYSLLYF